MRAFLTGGSGFVGTHLRAHLIDQGDTVALLADGVDIARGNGLAEAIEEADPEVVYHLAALTHVGASWEAPSDTFRVNVLGTVALIEAVRVLARPPRIILVSSAEVYGPGTGIPLTEQAPVRPLTPYAASKAAAELVGLQAVLGRHLDVVTVRPFNHVGPGQSDAFVVPAFCRRVLDAADKGDREIRTGDLSAARDFTDVRDVVRAYRLLALYGRAGEVYNVCSGTAMRIADLLDLIVELAGVSVTPVVDPDLVRPVEVPLLVGDASRLEQVAGWEPTIPLRETLSDVLAEARATRRGAR